MKFDTRIEVGDIMLKRCFTPHHIAYDFFDALTIAIDSLISRPLLKFNLKKRWYYTESVDIAFRHIGIKLFHHPELPSPPTVEQKIKDGTLTEIADFF